VPQQPWTVMVFMGADGVEGNKPLADEARADIREMGRIGSSESLNIFVQLHGDGEPRRYHVQKGEDGYGGEVAPPKGQD